MATANAQTLRVATFNVSMEATNYVVEGASVSGQELFDNLATGIHPQIQNIAAIIQHVRPDIVLLNEFDYTPDSNKGVQAFIQNYLQRTQGKGQPIDYSYFYTAPVNTGVDSGLDLDKDGIASGKGADAFGFGFYPGHYGMVVLSRYPIDTEHVRTFQHFLWKDMPDNLLTSIKDEQGQDYFSQEAQQILRLSSKSYWDLPIQINGQTLHILAAHPTPPVFDGPEDRNGKRNHDEIRFWSDYITPGKAAYIYDDKGQTGGFRGERFILVGDMNASVDGGNAMVSGIGGLLNNPAVNSSIKPTSKGGEAHEPANPNAQYFTAHWGMRADYVLPSKQGLKQVNQGVFWPTKTDADYPLVENRKMSSDHRMVWIDVELTD